MRYGLTVRDDATGRSADVLVDVDPRHTVAELVPVLLGALDAGRAGHDGRDPGPAMHPSFAAHVDVGVDGENVAPSAAVVTARVGPGSLVTLNGTGATLRRLPAGVAQIHVVNGPGAGRVHRLVLGRSTIGNGARDLSLPDLLLPTDTAVVTAATDGSVHVGIDAVGSPDPVQARVDSTALLPGQPVRWPVGALVRLGATTLQLSALSVADSDSTASPHGPWMDVNRPPRLLAPPARRTFGLPRPVGDRVKRPLPWLVVAAPMLMVIPMYFIFGTWRILLFALMSPILALANWLSDRRGARRRYLDDVARFDRETTEVEQRVAQALRDEQDQRRAAAPDPAAVLLTALGPGRRLWERRRSDADRLRLRVGLTDAVAETTVTDTRSVGDHREPPPPRQVLDVPEVVDVAAAGVVGVHGPNADRVAAWLVAQAAVHHAPRDLQIVFLAGPRGSESWNWLRWLPHCAPEDAPVAAMVGVDQDSTARRIAELTELVTTRLAARGAGGRGWVPPPPDVLLVVDGARRLRVLPAFVALLRDGPAAGVHSVCLEDTQALLPQECSVVVEAAETLAVRRSTAADVRDIRPDLVDPAWPERVARALAPLRDVTPDEDEGAGIPASARLLDLLGLDPPSAEDVVRRWQVTGGRTTETAIGVGFDGAFRIDLRRDGPHGLVAGTTGAGKSELLQSLVAGLAVANRPDALTFVLVDYKGGSAFRDCAGLPHTVGMVTDLDEHLVTRALTSLTAELRRRERAFAGAGATDLEGYWAAQVHEPGLATIPRLVLVIDEFAVLAKELPDFVTGLVNIAARGRSLGMHLVLATQRPSGVVSAEIRANTNLRICLRVTDDAESRDVIDSPDAARIGKHQPGRAYARTGASTLLPFQAARVGGQRPGAVATTVRRAPLAWPVPWAGLGGPAPQRPATATAVPGDPDRFDAGDTDLAGLVPELVRAARLAGIDQVSSPWLPALADVVTADRRHPGASWAVEDVPDQQAQRARGFDLAGAGHLFVVGGARSGRSTALRTLATRLASAHPPTELHIHALDCGNGALLGLRALPHVGAVVSRTETERADRLLQRLAAEMSERQQTLAAAGFGDVAEQWAAVAPSERMPYLLVLVDRWEGFRSVLGDVDGGRLTDTVQLLLAEGLAAGVHVAVGGDRSLLMGRMGALVEDKLILHLPDPADVTLAGLSRRQVPDHQPPGRGVWAASGLEAQVLVLDADTSTGGQSAAVERIAGALPPVADEDRARLPWRLAPLPGTISIAQLLARPMPPDSRWLPVGIGGDDAVVLGVDLGATPVLLVAGPPRSGRTTVLRALLCAARARGVPQVACLAPRGGGLVELAGDDLVPLDGSLEELVERLRAMPPGGLLLVDDAETLREGTWAPALTAVVQQARYKEWGVVLAGLTSDLAGSLSGWVADARRARQGLLLSPLSLGDGEAIGARLTRSMVLPRVQPGRGLLVRSGGSDFRPVQAPLA